MRGSGLSSGNVLRRRYYSSDIVVQVHVCTVAQLNGQFPPPRSVPCIPPPIYPICPSRRPCMGCDAGGCQGRGGIPHALRGPIRLQQHHAHAHSGRVCKAVLVALPRYRCARFPLCLPLPPLSTCALLRVARVCFDWTRTPKPPYLSPLLHPHQLTQAVVPMAGVTPWTLVFPREGLWAGHVL
jgi:hypothetical protein